MKRFVMLISYFIVFILGASAQNINGLVVHVANVAPAYIKFNDKIKTAEFSSPAAYDNYIIRVRNDDNTIIIQYNGNGINTDEGLTITEGNRSHFFIVSFLKDYDINKHKQLYYTFEDLKKLKQQVAQQSKDGANITEQNEVQEDIRRKEENERQKNIAIAEKQKKEAELQNKKKLEAEKKKQIELEKKEKDALAKAKKEQELREKERLLAQEKEKKIKEEQVRLQQQKIADEEKNRLALQQQQQLAKAQMEREAKEREEIKAQARLDSLKLVQQKKEEDALYTTLGLWKRYGQYGINLYEIPPEQKNWINGDFFIAADTIYNYNYAQELLKQPNISYAAEYGNFKDNVNLKLTGISFSGPFTYYKIKISNQSSEDFLTGGVVLDLYDKNKSHKHQLKCSYFTHISFYPIVPPNKELDVVFVTRTPVIDKTDDVVITLCERRTTMGKSYILFKATELLKEQNKREEIIQPNKGKKNKKKANKR